MSPKVSILVPIYGVEKFIERCAISLFGQTFESIEYIFVNDCTKDNSIKVLDSVIDRYPNRKDSVKIINHDVNRGLAAARNTGVENAKGEYILHIDSDDYIELNMVEEMYRKAFEEQADIVLCDILFEWENRRVICSQTFTDKDDLLRQTLQAVTIVGLVNKLFKRSLYIDNYIRSIEGINLGEDFITTPRLIYYSSAVSKVPKPFYHYIQYNSNSYTNNVNQKGIDDVLFVLNYLTEFFSQKRDYKKYKEALNKGKLSKKMDLLFSVNKQGIKGLMNTFPEVKELVDYSFLSKRDKLSMLLLDKQFLKLFVFYRSFYKMLYNLKNTLKGGK